MQNVDELCIKYVLNELDPSERLLVEQAMQDDENVLIEVESLRSTLRRLNNLPQMEPPKQVQRLILEKAAKETANKKSVLLFDRMAWAGFLAAAVILLAAGVNYIDFSGDAPIPNTTNAQETVATAGSAFVLQSNQATPLIPSAVTQRNTPEPWVDRQNVLQLQVTYGPNGQIILNPGTENENNNARALRPVQGNNNQRHALPAARDIQLTRTQN
jgi:anti-sigma factor RsiW